MARLLFAAKWIFNGMKMMPDSTDKNMVEWDSLVKSGYEEMPLPVTVHVRTATGRGLIIPNSQAPLIRLKKKLSVGFDSFAGK